MNFSMYFTGFYEKPINQSNYAVLSQKWDQVKVKRVNTNNRVNTLAHTLPVPGYIVTKYLEFSPHTNVCIEGREQVAKLAGDTADKIIRVICLLGT